MIRRKISDKHNLNTLGAGGLLTGGGALYAPVKDIFTSVFDIPCRTVMPVNPKFKSLADPRFSVIWGALLIAPDFVEELPGSTMLSRLFNRFKFGGRA